MNHNENPFSEMNFFTFVFECVLYGMYVCKFQIWQRNLQFCV